MATKHQPQRRDPASAPRGRGSASPRKHRRPSLSAHGEPMVWLIGGGLAVCSFMILALVALVVIQGAATFWPRPIAELTTAHGDVVLGVVARGEYIDAAPGDVEAAPGALGLVRRDLIQVGNRELSGSPFRWIGRPDVEGERYPDWAIFAERRTWGPMLGIPAGFIIDGEQVATAPDRVWALFNEHHPAVLARARQRHRLERVDSGEVNDREEHARLELVQARLRHGDDSPAYQAALARLDEVRQWARTRHAEIREQIDALNDQNERYRLVTDTSQTQAMPAQIVGRTHDQRRIDADLPTPGGDYATWRVIGGTLELRIADDDTDDAGDPPPLLAARDDGHGRLVQTAGSATLVAGAVDHRAGRVSIELDGAPAAGVPITASYRVQQQRELALDQIVRAYPANQLTLADKLGVYVDRWREFLTEPPREANTEGGVLPPIVGTVTMTLLMCIVVVPFGVLAALYLREYARGGPIVSAVRIAVNNLAGVPSIVFGVFGLGFFCYIVGNFVDSGPANPAGVLPWLVGLAMLAAVALAAAGATWMHLRTHDGKTPAARLLGYVTGGLWMITVGVTLWLVIRNPFFGGFFPAQAAEGNPVFNKGGVLWASLTLALLTLPVVIVATEEALAAVPRSMREGSYACGASKWQTIRRIVLPRAMPGIMTGMILAMARGAGEVAPLMLVGAVTMAQELPVSASAPFLHLDRSFMHLGFHIYDVGFQSPDSEGAKPMVYTTTLLLIGIIAVLNLAAFFLRTRLRRRFADGQF
ncbi:MAG: ABC transporter permease subunit [Phycisphaeraceae bacterium]